MFHNRQQFCLGIYGRHSVSHLRDTHVWVPVSDIDCRLVSSSDAAARRHSRLVCILEALLCRVLYCGHSTQYSHLAVTLCNGFWKSLTKAC